MKKLPLLLALLPAFVTGCHTASRALAPASRSVTAAAAQSTAAPIAASTDGTKSVQAEPPGDRASVAVEKLPDYWPADGRFPGRGQVSSWSGFRAHNAQRRAMFAAYQQLDQDGIVFVGDSITEGWHSLQQDFADIGVKVVNRGIGGDTTPNLLYRLQDDVLSIHPRALVILIGTNDLGAGTSPTDIAANLSDLHRRIRAADPQIPIAWCLVMPRGDGEQYVSEIPALNELIRKLAASDANGTVCDTYTPLATADGKDRREDFRPDNLHLNDAGYTVWRAALHPIVEQWHLAK
jgi:beta-glucosidase